MTVKIPDERQRWLLASTLLNLALSVAKLAWGAFAGSTIVTADGIHSISDVIGALLLYTALRYAGHRSARFPMGLNKLEDLAATAGGIGIAVAGFAIIDSVFFEAGIRTPDNIWPTLVFMIAVLAIQAVFYQFEARAAARLRSPGVRTDAVNWLGDIGAGSIVVIGILGHAFDIPHAQEVAVVLIVALIFKGAYEVLRDGLLSLLDASADLETVEKARAIIESHGDVAGIDRLYIRKAGSTLLAGISLQVRQRNIANAHRLMDRIEGELRDQIRGLDMITIHYEPQRRRLVRIATLLGADRQSLSHRFARAPWIRIQDIDDGGRIKRQSQFENPYAGKGHGKAVRLAAHLIRENVDVLVFDPREFEEDIRILLDSAGIEVTRAAPSLQETTPAGNR